MANSSLIQTNQRQLIAKHGNDHRIGQQGQIMMTYDVDGWIEYGIGRVWSMSYQSKQAIECKRKENVTLIIMDWWIEDGIG